MEAMVSARLWHERRVFLTGHTGFKGSWLSMWLELLGADVCGYSLPPDGWPSLFTEAGIGARMRSIEGDVRDLSSLSSVLRMHRPEVVFHLAAQPLVRYSYREPLETFDVNVLGTANLLEAVRQCDSVRAVVVVTSDKCYENDGSGTAFTEGDRLGGHDPYSSSKACAELVVAAYRRSFFPQAGYSSHGVALGSVRAGNVIGGGDWAEDRLIPDAIRAFIAGHAVRIRNPHAIRPWQHVLEPLRGYLMLAEHLLESGPECGDAWNFGPLAHDALPVQVVIEKLACAWGEDARWEINSGPHPHEAHTLQLDCWKAQQRLGWVPTLRLADALELTADWYRRRHHGECCHRLTAEQIVAYASPTVPAAV